MSPAPYISRRRRLESWLWTGPAGHLVGGALDLGEALTRHGLVRLASRRRGPAARRAGPGVRGQQRRGVRR